MTLQNSLCMALCLLMVSQAAAQITKSEQDSLFILQIESEKEPGKVLHAEPLYIDLIRDLGAGKAKKNGM